MADQLCPMFFFFPEGRAETPICYGNYIASSECMPHIEILTLLRCQADETFRALGFPLPGDQLIALLNWPIQTLEGMRYVSAWKCAAEINKPAPIK